MAFKEIIGQDAAIRTLLAAKRKGKIAPVYLFYGPDGVGKFLAAKNFAKLLNCTNHSVEKDCCDVCNHCKQIENENYPDVFFIKDDDTIKIEQVRDMKWQLALKPVSSSFKVIIIKNASFLSHQAQSALLKTLEDMQFNAVCVLVTSNISTMLPTIISRAELIRFFQIKSEDIKNFLQDKLSFTDNQAEAMSHIFDGSIRASKTTDIESYMDSRERVFDFIINKNDISRRKKDFFDFKNLNDMLNIMITWYRDVLLYKAGISKNFFINYDRIVDIEKCGVNIEAETLVNHLGFLLNSKIMLEENVSPKLIYNSLFIETNQS